MLKKMFSLMLITVMLTACLFCANAAVLTKKEKYDAALKELISYLNDEGTEELKNIFNTFASLGSYEYSTGFMLYTNVLIGIESGDYSFVQSNINMMRRDAKFAEHLSKTEIFGTIDDVENYANGRRAEKEGDLLSAMAYYENANSYLDSFSRLFEMQSAIYEEKYAAAMAAFEAGTYEGYAECAALLEELAVQRYRDSEGYLLNAQIMMEVMKPCEHEWQDATCLHARKCAKCGETDGMKGEHKWQEATCTTPKTCKYCAATQGNALNHNWQTATCTTPKTCTRCSITSGSAKGHEWQEATCTTPKTCKNCAATQGNALNHNWQTATCTTPKTCTRCSMTSGSAKGHDWLAATTMRPETCSVCGLTRGNPLIRVGSFVTFGKYEQDNNTGNGKEPIEWQVLEIKDGKALLISKYGLDEKPYNTEYKLVTWETCTLRRWLNNDFMNAAFTGEEQGRITFTNVDNSKSQGYSGWSTTGGSNTQDKIFLLSYAEANRYFGVTWENTSNTESRISPTAYAESNGAYTNDDYKTADGANAGRWWLRSPGRSQSIASSVNTDGSLSNDNVNRVAVCVRPALWMNLES